MIPWPPWWSTSFAAGLMFTPRWRLWDLLAHAGALALLLALGVPASWWVIRISAPLLLIEFFADKIPPSDLVWDPSADFIRVPIAALLAYRATAALSPWEQSAATAAGGLIALAAHGGNTAARSRRHRVSGTFLQRSVKPGRRRCSVSFSPGSPPGIPTRRLGLWCSGGDYCSAGALGAAGAAGTFPGDRRPADRQPAGGLRADLGLTNL